MELAPIFERHFSIMSVSAGGINKHGGIVRMAHKQQASRNSQNWGLGGETSRTQLPGGLTSPDYLPARRSGSPRIDHREFCYRPIAWRRCCCCSTFCRRKHGGLREHVPLPDSAHGGTRDTAPVEEYYRGGLCSGSRRGGGGGGAFV